MSPFEHGEVFVLDDGGEVSNMYFSITLCYEWLLISRCTASLLVIDFDALFEGGFGPRKL